MSSTFNRLFAGTIFICAAFGDAAADAPLQDEADEGLTAMVEVVDGSTVIVIDELNQQRLALKKIHGPSSPFAELSTREFEIFCLLAEGLNAAKIGKRPSLSSKTIVNYATQIKNKLEVSSIAEIARLAIRHDIVDA